MFEISVSLASAPASLPISQATDRQFGDTEHLDPCQYGILTIHQYKHHSIDGAQQLPPALETRQGRAGQQRVVVAAVTVLTAGSGDCTAVLLPAQ